jgi:hypothetical protein
VEAPSLPGGRFGPAPFRLRNALADHPLFEPERIRRLLRTLPRRVVEVRRVETSDAQSGTYRRGPLLEDADPVAAFDALEERPTWMLLHETWKHDPDYARLLHDYLRDLREGGGELGAPLSDMGCWMFLSSGRSVVHFHADPDQSFLNQVRGSKTVFVYPAEVLPEEVVEQLVYFQDQGVVRWKEDYEARMYPPTHLAPGESVFLPLYAPHRVVNDDGVCVSWNVGFNTRASRRRRAVHCVNLELRHLGMRPSALGRRPLRDALKARLGLPFRVKNRLLPGSRPRPDLEGGAAPAPY